MASCRQGVAPFSGLYLHARFHYAPGMASQTVNTGYSSSIRVRDGRAVIVVDGAELAPYFYALTHSFAGRASWEEPKQKILRDMAAAGVRLYQVDVYFQDIWFQDRPDLDIAYVQKQLGGVIAACPDACIVLRIHVNAPFWWNELHPEECTQFADGPVDWKPKGGEWSHESGDNDRALRASLASELWRKESGQRLIELCQRLAQTPEARNLIGFHVSGGIFGEWHYWGTVKHEPDTGPAMTAAFRRFLSNRYGTDAALQEAWRKHAVTLSTATVPGMDERNATALSIFRDPQQHRHYLDYLDCQMEQVADDIEYFCGIVKKHWPRPTITGVFYGYFHMLFCRTPIIGHACIERILNSPVVDYLSAPQSYWGASRKLGGSGLSRGIIDATIHHGKLWLDELDNGGEQKGIDDPNYLPVVRRSALMPLLRGQGFWYYDFGIGQGYPGWFGGPKNLEMIRQQKQLADASLAVPRKSAADVLFVWDYHSQTYITTCWTPTTYMQIEQSIEDALRAGAAIDEVYFFDLDRIDLSQYRAIVFGNAHCLTDVQRKIIEEKLATAGRTLVFNYLPGITDGETLSLDHVSRATGFAIRPADTCDKPHLAWTAASCSATFEAKITPFVKISETGGETLATVDGHPACVRKSFGNHTRIYCTVPILGTPAYREIFRAAGCHLYQDRDEPIWANSQYVMLHTASGGDRTLKLRNGRQVPLSLPGPSTLLLDAQTGEVILR